MQIVITDGYTLNPGDLSWKPFEALGEVVLYDRTPEELVSERCRHANVIITNKTPVSSSVIASASALKVIAVTATGYNVIDVDAAAKKAIPVCNVPGYGTDSVAQHTFALLLELTNHVGKNAFSVHQGDWSRSADWCYSKGPITELSGKTLGIIGFGRIGQRVAGIAQAFGMNVVYADRSDKSSSAPRVSLEELFSQSDVVSLHCPLKDDNHSFVNERLLSRMKPGAFLVNTARGQLINEQDLATALRNGAIAGAALDVLSKEPPPPNHPLLGLPTCLITPHTAWLSLEARRRIMDTTYDNVAQALAGKPQNNVNFKR
jgi:glycerate dehydrogenase